MTRIDYTKYNTVLDKNLTYARGKDSTHDFGLSKKMIQNVGIVMNDGGKAFEAVILTSLTKKIVFPEQDIRLHLIRLGENRGYSGRSLDTNVTTPFLRQHYFEFMKGGTGWLTKSFAQGQAYTLNYFGAIRPENAKHAFLQIIDDIQTGVNPNAIMQLMLRLMIQRREDSRIALSEPENLPIRDIIDYLDRHFTHDYGAAGASRLPVLAIYAACQVILDEVSRYRHCTLNPLESHTAADERTGAIGDIEIVGHNGKVFEAVEIKHGQAITVEMIRNAFEKFENIKELDRYYLLTTYEEYEGSNEVSKELLALSNRHSCQIIVNGVMHTLKYYLRLLKSPNLFIKKYTELMGIDPAIQHTHKERWNAIVEGGH